MGYALFQYKFQYKEPTFILFLQEDPPNITNAKHTEDLIFYLDFDSFDFESMLQFESGS
jgi:hypothetical protein